MSSLSLTYYLKQFFIHQQRNYIFILYCIILVDIFVGDLRQILHELYCNIYKIWGKYFKNLETMEARKVRILCFEKNRLTFMGILLRPEWDLLTPRLSLSNENISFQKQAFPLYIQRKEGQHNTVWVKCGNILLSRFRQIPEGVKLLHTM